MRAEEDLCPRRIYLFTARVCSRARISFVSVRCPTCDNVDRLWSILPIGERPHDDLPTGTRLARVAYRSCLPKSQWHQRRLDNICDYRRLGSCAKSIYVLAEKHPDVSGSLSGKFREIIALTFLIARPSHATIALTISRACSRSLFRERSITTHKGNKGLSAI